MNAWLMGGGGEWPQVWAACLPWIRRWGRPRGWDRANWLDEAKLVGGYAYVLACRKFDPSRGVPRPNYLRWQIWEAVWAEFRRQGKDGRHRVEDYEVESHASLGRAEVAPFEDRELTELMLTYLRPEDRQLLKLRYEEGWTEKKIAQKLDLSQSTISERITRLHKELRRKFGPSHRDS